MAVLARVIAAYFFNSYTFPDSQAYFDAGQRLFNIGQLHNPKVMPLYLIISYISNTLFQSNLIDLLFSAGSVYLVYELAQQLFSDRKTAILSSSIFAFYPFSIFYANSGLTESSFVFTMFLAFVLLYKRQLWLASICLVLSVLIRPSLDYLNPVLIIVFSVLIYKESWIKNLGKYILIYVLLLLPWWIYNYNVYDQFVRLNLGAGEMIYGGNNPNNLSGRANEDSLDFTAYKDMPLVKRDKALKHDAFNYIMENKKEFIFKSFKRFVYFWNIFPNHKNYRSGPLMLISAISMLLLYIGSIAFVFLSDRKTLIYCLPIVLVFIYLTMIHSVTIASIRYRFPLEAFMIIFLSYTLVKVFFSSKQVHQ